MKRLSLLGLTLVLASPLAAQWTEGGARIGANLDTLVVTFQGMGTLFRLSTFADAADMYVKDTLGNTRFSVWGNGAGGGGQINLYDATNTRTIILRAGASSGPGAVTIPQDAIQSFEISNEAGVASAAEGINTVPLTGGTWDTLLIQTIVAPDSGFLLVLGSAQISLGHASGTTSHAQFGVFVDGSAPDNQDVALRLDGNASSGLYVFPVAVQTLMPVSAGAHDVTFEGYEFSGSVTALDMQLSVVYLPTAYGTVVTKTSTTNIPDDQAPRRTVAPSAQQIRAESEQANQARIQAEIQKIRKQLAELEAELRTHETR